MIEVFFDDNFNQMQVFVDGRAIDYKIGIRGTLSEVVSDLNESYNKAGEETRLTPLSSL